MPDDLFAQLSTAFLRFSSTMPYDSSNVEAVRPWLELSLPDAGTDGETIVFGDARFTIYNTGRAAWLFIENTPMNNLSRPSGWDFQPGKIERTFGNVVNADELHQQALQERYPGRSKILPVVREAAGTETDAPGKWRGLRLPASKRQVENRRPCAISPR